MDCEPLIPMRWPCGPLDIAEGRRRAGFTVVEADALERWSAPETLEILAGTPVNCLVVTWAEGSEGDGAHQRAMAPLVTAARRRGLSVVGWVAAEADLRAAAASARASGLDALATGSREPVPGFDVLRFRELGIAERSPVGFLGVVGAAWPGLKVNLESFLDAQSGPTGPPWIDSNAWYVRLARDLLRPNSLWLSFDPDETGRPVPAASYVLAIADSEVYGARWVISLDPHLRLGLCERKPSARETWAAITRGVTFFGEHRAWGNYRPVAHLGVISEFAGGKESLSLEVLNLLARQGSAYRVVERSQALETSLDGLRAVLFLDGAPPDAVLVEKLDTFVREGGTLITPPGWEERGTLQEDAWPLRFRVLRHGRGRLAVAREGFSDPPVLAQDARLLMSHRHDPVRVFNAGAALSHYCLSKDRGSGVLHLVRFVSRYYRMPVTAWFRRAWTSARVWCPDATEARPCERKVVDSGVEFSLESVPEYCALEVSA